MTNDKGILIQNIYYMLSYAFHILKQEDYKQVAGEPFDKVHDLFSAILEKGIARQLKQGLYREYVPMLEELSVMRGKLDMNGTIRLQMQKKQKIACEFEEFSEDNLYNQILKLTMYILIHADDVAPERKQALKKRMMFFDNVKLIQPECIDWSRLIYQWNNRNYELLMNLCYLIWNDMLQTTEKGKYRLLSFSEERMERLFEKFILEYYKQHHPELKPKASVIEWNHTEKSDTAMIQFLPKMKTDIVLTKENQKLIIDAKYYRKSLSKNYDKETWRSSHLYQIFAYVKNMDKDNSGNVSGLLLYAKTEDEVFPEGEPLVICGNRIGIRGLDLNREFRQVGEQLEGIAEGYFG